MKSEEFLMDLKAKIEKLNKSKTPIVKINKSLDKYAEKVLFPEKVEEANKTLKNVGIPKLRDNY